MFFYYFLVLVFLIFYYIFRTTPEIMADVTTYDHKELLVILFNHVSNFLSVGSGWRFDSVLSLSISLCPFRPTIGAGSYIETAKSLHSKGVLNIQNKNDDYCFIWCILGHIHRVEQNPSRLSHYTKYFNQLVIEGLQFPLKFSHTPKFEDLNPSISVTVLVFENNEVFPLYASKHRDRKHHVNLLMISNNEGKFHHLLVRNLSALAYERTKHHGYKHECPYSLFCFKVARLLTAHLPDCSIHPEQNVKYPLPDDPEKNMKKFKAIAKTLSVPFVLYADFEAFLVPAEEIKESASNTKVRQLHKPSGFACLRVSQVPELNIYLQRRKFDDGLLRTH